MNPEQGTSRPKISFGGLKKAIPAVGNGRLNAGGNALTRTKSLLNDEEDDEQDGHTPTQRPSDRLKGVAGAAPMSKAERQRQAAAMSIDESVFEYDGVYDSMKTAERQRAAERDLEKQNREAKYMHASIAASEQRKLDRTRAEARKIQREREQEGDAYADTESFVTDAYKRQLQEMRDDEERQRLSEEQARKSSRGVAGFYKDLLAEQDRTHRAAMEAASQTAVPTQGEAPGSPSHQEPTSEEQRRRARIEEAKRKGLSVTLNDENDVVDDRSLLTAGLNAIGSAAKKRKTVDDGSRNRPPYGGEANHRPNPPPSTSEAARQAQRSRQSQMLEEQMLAMQQQRQQEEEAEVQSRKQTITSNRRNNAERIEQARQRALLRRKQAQDGPGL